jgi:molybdopterin synthase catalytic subunit
MEQVLLTREPLDQAAVVAQVTTPEHGAVVTFEGIVRNHSRGSSVSHLEYEAYEPLALAQLLRIVAEAQERWTARCDAFEACRWLMESLKSTTPIWKKEFASGGAQWIEGSDAIASSG